MPVLGCRALLTGSGGLEWSLGKGQSALAMPGSCGRQGVQIEPTARSGSITAVTRARFSLIRCGNSNLAALLPIVVGQVALRFFRFDVNVGLRVHGLSGRRSCDTRVPGDPIE